MGKETQLIAQRDCNLRGHTLSVVMLDRRGDSVLYLVELKLYYFDSG